MAQTVEFISDEIGNQEDTVAITVHNALTGVDTPVQYVQAYHVEECVLSQPSRWNISLGFDTVARELFWSYPPGAPFSLSLYDCVQLTGRVDGRQLRRSGSGSILTLTGRDALAPLHDSYVAATTSFADQSYADLVRAALKASGLDPGQLVLSNTNNRKIKAGIPIQEVAQAPADDLITQQPIVGTLGATSQELQAKAGERWLDYLHTTLARAGLTLWASGDGHFVLSTPNGQQAPAYQVFRQIAADDLTTNVLDWQIGDDATNRHSEVIVYGRGGGRKKGAQKAKGYFVDQEMKDLGYVQALVIHDRDVQTGDQAAYLARRRLAEERRAGWHLEYKIAGHTLPAAQGGGARAVVIPDTTIQIADDLLGVYGVFYIETVQRMRSEEEGTCTVMRLMRTGDLVFGEVSNNAPKAVQVQVQAGSRLPSYNYFGEGVPDIPPPEAVGQNAAGQFVDASGTPIP